MRGLWDSKKEHTSSRTRHAQIPYRVATGCLSACTTWRNRSNGSEYSQGTERVKFLTSIFCTIREIATRGGLCVSLLLAPPTSTVNVSANPKGKA